MADDLNTVKTAGRGYHHGALRAALVEAAETVIAERGVDGFSLREAARRAGVSPAAPAHHFGDVRGLLTEIAALAFEGLATALEAADASVEDADRQARMLAQGGAYVRFALANRARFDLMWRSALLDPAHARYAAAAARAYAVLERGALGAVAPRPAGIEQAAPIAAWSIVHGFARLLIDDAMPTIDPEAADVDRLLPAVLAHLSM